MGPDTTDSERATFVGGGVGPRAVLMARGMVEGVNSVVGGCVG